MSSIDAFVLSRRARLASDQNGSVAIIFGLSVTVLFGIVGLAIDFSRSVSVSSRLLSALDAAALAGAKKLDGGASDSEVQEAANAYFDQQKNHLKIGDVAVSALNIQIDRSNTTVSTNVNATMATTFGRVIGFNSVNLNRASSVSYKVKNVELSLALDITGSMSDGNKIGALRSAATDIVDEMLKDQTDDSRVRVALVPWSSSVNAGSLAATVSGGLSVDDCVVEREGSNAATDYSPSAGGAVGVVTSTPYGWYSCPTASVVPLAGKSKLADLKSAISNLQASGGTAGHIGTAWGWYMLSPEWSNVLPTSARPMAYDPTTNIKATVIMTDGLFNMAYLGSPPAGAEVNESYTRFQALCQGMKDKRVLIYTVGFGLTDSRAVSEMLACATDSSKFFQAASGSDLKKVFINIANQLQAIRITK